MGIYFAFIKKIKPRKQREPTEIAGDIITPAEKNKLPVS
jgi:hypothetical protein